MSASSTLDTTPTGRLSRISAVEGTDRLRLAELGLRVGALVTVVRRTAGGGRLLALGVDRIAVDRATARRVMAEAL